MAAPVPDTVFAHLGDVSADVIVVNNDSHDETTEVVATEFPDARVVWSRNLGFGHANNRGVMTCNARYVLFLNPDTEILEGTFAELVRMMDARPTVGLVGVRQVTPDGRLDMTIRRFPNALRALGEALLAERLPRRPHGSASARSTAPPMNASPPATGRAAPSCSRAGRPRERRLLRRAVLHLLRRDRFLPADQGRGLGDPAPAADDDPPSRRQGRREPEDLQPRRLHPPDVCAEVPLARTSSGVHGGPDAEAPGAFGLRGPRRDRESQAGREPARDRHAARTAPVPFAAITSEVSVQTARPELRRGPGQRIR